jgi:AcrR family transcriptional regulator
MTTQVADDEGAGRARRRYRSPRREMQAQATRDALLAAAARLFTTRGWGATGMRDIAREAGVATETIYAHFSSKADLLRRVIDIAVVGDDAPTPVAGRPGFAAIGQGSRSQRIAAAARVVTAVHQRTAGFAKVLREAAPTDEAIAEELHDTRERQRLDVEAGATLLLGRPPTAAERDGLWALVSAEVYLLLVEASGWSVDQYETWVASTMDAVIAPT